MTVYPDHCIINPRHQIHGCQHLDRYVILETGRRSWIRGSNQVANAAKALCVGMLLNPPRI